MSKRDKESALKNVKTTEDVEVVNNEQIELLPISNPKFALENEPNFRKLTTNQDEQQALPQRQFFAVKIMNEKKKELFLQDCNSKEDVLATLSSVVSKNVYANVSVLVVQLDGDFILTSSKERNDLERMFIRRAVVVILNPINLLKPSIYWKTSILDYLLVLNPFDENLLKENESFHNFLVVFLINSIKNGHLGITSTYSINPESFQIDFNLLADQHGYNLLLIAAEEGNVEIVQLLLKLGMISDLLHVDAQSVAWNKRNYDVLLELLKSNLTYPKSFEIKKCPPNLKEFYFNSHELHKAIKAMNKDGLEDILAKNQGLKYCYNSINNSALKTAINAKSPEIYDILLERKLRFAPHEDVEELYEGLDYKMKRTLREIHNKHSQVSDQKHLNILMANSFISHDDENAQRNYDHIQGAFRTLNMNAFIKIILMIVAASKKFKIIFDFNRDSVNIIDPTVESNTQGLFYLSGRIYIGAKQLLNNLTEHETFGVIAHELCHYAVNVVYNNEAKPYKYNDNQTMQEFEKISIDSEENCKKEQIVDLVYECYPQEAHHAEIIVRVVHMLAYYYNQPEKILELRGIFGGLFKFYETKVVPEMEAALPGIEKKVEDEIKKKDKKISKLRNISIFFGLLAVLGILGGISFAYFFQERKYVFSKLSESEMAKVENGLVNYKNVDVKFSSLFDKNSTAYAQLKSDDIAKILNGITLNLSHPDSYYLDILVDLKWTCLADELKQAVLNSDFIFQNEILKLNDLYNVSSEIFDKLSFEQLKSILKERKFAIGSIIKNEEKSFVERNFFLEDIYPIYYDYMNNVTRTFYARFDGGTNTIVQINREFNDIFDDYMSLNFDNFIRKIDNIRDSENFKILFHSNFVVEENDTISDYKIYQFNFDKIVEIVNEKRMFILSNEAGMGKTFTFKEFVTKLKKKFPLRWIFYIELREFMKDYYSKQFSGNLAKTLANNLDVDVQNGFETELFENLYESGNLIFLWNGFDEISKNEREIILNITNSIFINSRNIQFICTRPLYSKQLRDTFKVLTHTLVPLDREKQNQFLEKLFETRNVDTTLIDMYINRTHEIISSNIFDANIIGDFNSPLMLGMIGGLVADGKKLFKSGNAYEIYEKFVETKVEIWQNKSTNASKFSNQQLTSKFVILDIFQKFALLFELRETFTEFSCSNIKELKIFQTIIPKRFSKEEISSMGILYLDENDEFQFAHKTFAEFFVAQHIVQNLYNAKFSSNEEAELYLELFYQVVRLHAAGNIVTGNFINSYISNEVYDEFYANTFDSKFVKALMKSKPKLFFDFLKDRSVKTMELLFNFFKKDHKLLTDLLQVYQKETLYTSVFNLPNYDNMKLKNISRKYLTDHEFLQFINGIDQRGKVLFVASKFVIGLQTEPPGVDYSDYILPDGINFFTKNSFEVIRENLTEGELKEVFLSETSGAIDDFLTNEEFFESAEEFLTDNEFKQFIKIVLKKCASAYYHQVSSFPFIFEKVVAKFSNSEIKQYFVSNDILLIASMHDESVFEYMWNFFLNLTTEAQQAKEMILHPGSIDFSRNLSSLIYTFPKFCSIEFKANIFQISLLKYCDNRYYDQTFIYVKSVYMNYLNGDEWRKMILDSNDYLLFVLEFCELEPLIVFFSILKEQFEGHKNSLQEFLQKLNETVLRYKFPRENVEIFKSFLIT